MASGSALSIRHSAPNVCHDDPAVGHLGRDKTAHEVCQRYRWPGLRCQVATYVASCFIWEPCKLSNLHQEELRFRHSDPPNVPSQLVGIDPLGPFAQTPAGSRLL